MGIEMGRWRRGWRWRSEDGELRGDGDSDEDDLFIHNYIWTTIGT